MKNAARIFLLSCLIISVTCYARAQELTLYQHSELGFEFTASPNWTEVSENSDDLVCEYVNPNHNMSLRIWYSSSSLPVLEQLGQKICEMGHSEEEGPFDLVVDNRPAYGICALCSEMRQPYKVMLVAMPVEDGTYMIRIKCPEDCFPQHEQQVLQLLGSLSFQEKPEASINRVFYALNDCF